MNTIITLTDFSNTADNALNYAIKLAEMMELKIVLLHIHPLLNDHLDADAVKAEINKKALEQLERNDKTGTDIELLIYPGIIEEALIKIPEEKNADLILIGMTEGGIFEETILGINAVDIIRNSTSPILIIPARASFRIPTKVVFATDYIELKNKQTLFALINFVALFKAKLFIVNVMSEDEKTSSRKVASIIHVKKLLSRIDHSFHYPYNDNVVDGINEFVSETDSEIVAIIPHKHNIFYRLLNLSNTKKMIFHSSIPILALPENIPAKGQPIETEISYSKIDYNIYTVYNFDTTTFF
jgi:nucleotide-binding universal stress UspA family protein